jgi:multisubunit Na+/H+ antiporter MnhB subunit
MTVSLALDAGLAAVVLAMAGWTLAARSAFAAIVGFVAYGLLLAIVWVRLAAADVALTEAAIGSGVTGVVLLVAAARLRPAEAPAAANRPGAVLRSIAAVLCALISAGLAALVLFPPSVAPTLAPLAVTNLASTGLGNAVTGVLLAYRAIDTFLEIVVLLLALLGVWSLTPDQLWGGAPGTRQLLQPDDPLTILGRVLPPIGILVGVYIFWVGSSDPGGEFQGATILAAMWMLVVMAGLGEAPPIGRKRLRLLLVVGPVVFLGVGLAGFAFADGFLSYPTGYAKALILAIEAPLLFSVAAMLGLLAAGPPARPDAS